MPLAIPDPAVLTAAVLWGGLAIGLLFGAAAQASRFCVRGAVADWVESRNPARAQAWLLAVAVAAVGTQALVAAGAFDATRALAWNERFPWLAHLVGGALLGVGMVLAGGCPQRCLVRAGAGNLRSWVVLGVVAVSALMTLRGLFAVPRVQWLEASALALGRPQDLGSLAGGWLGLPAGALRIALTVALVVVAAVVLWRARLPRAQWVGAAAVGGLVTAAWWLTGRVGFLEEHPETLEAAWLGTQSRRPEGLSFTAPLAHGLDLLTLWTDRNTVLSFGVVVALGAVAGSALAALWRGEFRLEGFSSPRELARHLAGGVLMGFGGVTALGCSVGQGVTGLAMLSAGALLAVPAMVAGAWLALRLRGAGAAASGQRAGAARPTAV